MTTRLQWPKSPSRTRHRILGLRQRWTERGGRYRIERFSEDGNPLFIVLVCEGGGWRVIDRRRKLNSAKLCAQTHSRKEALCHTAPARPA